MTNKNLKRLLNVYGLTYVLDLYWSGLLSGSELRRAKKLYFRLIEN